MIVRELEKQERKYALDIIWSVFCMDVAEVWLAPEVGLIHFANI